MRRALPLLLFVVVAVLYMANPNWSGTTEAEHIQPVTEAGFAEAVEATPGWVLVDFWATWCGPCRRLMPQLDAVAAEQGERVRFVKVDIDAEPGLARRFQVESVPQVYLFKDGVYQDHFMGYRSADAVRAWLAERGVELAS